MNNAIFLVLAYMLIWIVLFGYIWNILKKQQKLAREVDLLKSEIRGK
jgi:CcmD family protein